MVRKPVLDHPPHHDFRRAVGLGDGVEGAAGTVGLVVQTEMRPEEGRIAAPDWVARSSMNRARSTTLIRGTASRWTEETKPPAGGGVKPRALLSVRAGDRNVCVWPLIPWISTRGPRVTARLIIRRFHVNAEFQHQASSDWVPGRFSSPCSPGPPPRRPAPDRDRTEPDERNGQRTDRPLGPWRPRSWPSRVRTSSRVRPPRLRPSSRNGGTTAGATGTGVIVIGVASPRLRLGYGWRHRHHHRHWGWRPAYYGLRLRPRAYGYAYGLAPPSPACRLGLAAPSSAMSGGAAGAIATTAGGTTAASAITAAASVTMGTTASAIIIAERPKTRAGGPRPPVSSS